MMPNGFNFPSPDIDLWIPRRLDPESQNFGGHSIAGIARLRPGVTTEAAVADAESLSLLASVKLATERRGSPASSVGKLSSRRLRTSSSGMHASPF